MANEKVYVGKGKKFSFQGGGEVINFSIKLSEELKNSAFEFKGEKYVKLAIKSLKEADKFGKTHTVYIDSFEPKGDGGGNNGGQKQNVETNDLPF